MRDHLRRSEMEAEWNQIESQHFNWPFGFDAILKRFKYEYQKNGRDQFIHFEALDVMCFFYGLQTLYYS